MGKKVVHFADKADREIGTAKCGVRMHGNHCTDVKGDVTCERCGGAEKPIAEAVVHFDFGADIGTGSCGDDPSRSRTQCLSNVTCLACLRHKVRLDGEWANHQSAVIAMVRANLEDAQERAKQNAQRVLEVSVINEGLEKRLHDVMAGLERATQTGLDACHEADVLKALLRTVQNELNAARVKIEDLERDLAAARDDAERVAQSHACLAVELKRWKQAAADLAGAGQSLLSCALAR